MNDFLSRLLGGLPSDFRVALRGLFRAPAFTAVVVLTLALGLGANTAVFSVVYPVLLEPLPFAEPERLVRLYNHPVGNPEVTYEASIPDWRTFRESARTLDDLAGYATSSGGLLLELEDGSLERMGSGLVTWNLFSTLGVGPHLGRTFSADDDVTGAAPTVLLSEDLWRERFSADPAILGRTLEIEGETRTVIGILPQGVEYPVGARLWIPVATAVPESFLENAQLKFMNLVGRLQPGATLEQAQEEIRALQETVTNPPLPASAHSLATLGTLTEELVGDTRGPLLFLLGAALLLLGVAAANVGNLQLVRAVARRRELAVRAALGAGRRRIARLTLVESLWIALAAGVLGTGLAALGIERLMALNPQTFFRAGEVGIHPPVLGFTLLLVALAAGIFGLLPAWYGTHGPLARVLQSSQRSTGGRLGRRVLSGSVVAQVSLALVLLLGAGLLMRSFARLQAVDAGFSRQGVLTLAVPYLGDTYQDPASQDALYDRLVERVSALPGVEGAGGVLIRPLQSLVGYDFPLTVEGRPEEDQASNPLVNYQAVTPGTLRALGVPLLEGRAFTPADREDAPPVVIVSRPVAELLWPGESPVGQRLKWGGPESSNPWIEVVGVVGDGRYRRLEDVSLNVYVPHRQSPWPLQHLVVRSAGSNPTALLGAVRRAIRDVDPALRPVDVATTEQMVSRSLARPRFLTLLLGLFAALALVLGAVGLYGMLSYLVTLRRREIGIRMALGARPGDALQLALGRALWLTSTGIAAGLVAGLVLSRLLEGMLSGVLYEVSHFDPWAFVAGPLGLLVVALLAALWPALRAGRVDPAEALRSE